MQSTFLATSNPPYGTLCLRGEFGADARVQLRTRLDGVLDLACRHLTIDAGEVTHIDVGSLRLLLDACDTLRQRGGRLQVVRASSIFVMVAGLAGCHDLLPPPFRTAVAARPA